MHALILKRLRRCLALATATAVVAGCVIVLARHPCLLRPHEPRGRHHAPDLQFPAAPRTSAWPMRTGGLRLNGLAPSQKIRSAG
jgi:hypothetical protein